MKMLIAMLFLFSTVAFATSQEKYADDVAKAKVDYNRAKMECKAMYGQAKADCLKRTEAMWKDVQKGLKAQLGKK